MKKVIVISLSIAAMLVGLASCKKAPRTSVEEFNVNVTFSDDFKADAKYESEVTIVNNTTKAATTVKAVGSVATFKNVEFGSYTVSAAGVISNAEFKAIAKEDVSATVTSEVALNSPSTKVVIASEDDVVAPVSVQVSWSVPSTLLISRMYTFGTLNLAGAAYNSDKYIEIFNNSTETQYADGLCVAEEYSSAVSKGPYTNQEEKGVIYLKKIVRLPGSGTQYPIEPGKSIVIAQNAKNHKDPAVVTNTVDLSGAEFEAFVENAPAIAKLEDNADVPNIIDLYSAASTNAKFMVGTGCIYVLFRATDAEISALGTVLAPGTDSYAAWGIPPYYCVPLPKDKVIDAVDTIRETFEKLGGHHLPSSVDAGWAMLNQKKIALRKIARVEEDRVFLQDTNNSTNDFVMVESTDGNGTVFAPKNYEIPEIQPK